MCICKRHIKILNLNQPNILDNKERAKTAWTKKKAYFQKYQYKGKMRR